MISAHIILLAQLLVAVLGIAAGVTFLIRGSAISWRTPSILLVLFCLTLIAAAMYSNSLVNAANRQQDLEKKISALSDALLLNPSPKLYTRRAEVLSTARERERALRDVDKAIAIAPDNVEASTLRV